MLSPALTDLELFFPWPTCPDGSRHRPPRVPTAVGDESFREVRVALICLTDPVLQSNIALELRSRGYHVVEARSAEDLLLRSVHVRATMVLSDNLHVIGKAKGFLTSEDQTRLCAVMMRDDPYAEVDAYLVGATEVLTGGA